VQLSLGRSLGRPATSGASRKLHRDPRTLRRSHQYLLSPPPQVGYARADRL